MYFHLLQVYAWRQNSDIFILSNSVQLFLVDLKTFPGRRGYIIPPACSGYALRSPSRWTCLKNLHRRHAQTTLADAFQSIGAIALLCTPPGWWRSPPYKPYHLRPRPATLQRNPILVACIWDLVRLGTIKSLHDHKWGLEQRQNS